MRNKASRDRRRWCGCSRARATRCCPPPRPRTRCSSTCRATSTVTVTASPGKGLERHPRPGRAAGRPRLHRRTPPGRADGARPRRARRDLRPADRQGDHPGLRARRRRRARRATTPTRCRCCEDLAELGRPFAQVGITGYPESHPTIHDDLTVQSMWDKRRYATHIVSNLTFDPAVIRDWVRPDARARRHHAAAARHPRPGRPHQAAVDGHQDRRRRVDPVPGQAQGHLRPAGRARRLHRRAVPRAVRARRWPSPTRWSRGCTSSRSTRSPRPRPGGSGCSTGCRG